MNHSDLNLILSCFKTAREQLTSDFINENIEIYEAMFRFEKNEQSMLLSIDKYFMSWIDNHFNLFNELTNDDTAKDILKEFTKRMLLMIQQSVLSLKDADIERGNQLFFDLLNEKTFLLESLSTITTKADNNYKRLVYTHEKDKALFERKLAELTGETL